MLTSMHDLALSVKTQRFCHLSQRERQGQKGKLLRTT